MKTYTGEEHNRIVRIMKEKFYRDMQSYKEELMNMGVGKIRSIQTKYGSNSGPIIIKHNIKNIYETSNGIIIELQDKPLPDTIETIRCKECRTYIDIF